MRKRTNICYLANLWRETWLGTITFLREYIVHMFEFVVLVFIVAAIYRYHSGDAPIDAVRSSLVIGITAALIVFICALLVNYGNADFNLWRADGKVLDIKEAEIDTLTKHLQVKDTEIDSLTKRILDLQKTKPDMSIADASQLAEERPRQDDSNALDFKGAQETAARVAEIASLNTRIYNQDAEIASLNRRLYDQDAEIESLNKYIYDIQNTKPEISIGDAIDDDMPDPNLTREYPRQANGKELVINDTETELLKKRIFDQDAEIESLNKRIRDFLKPNPDTKIADAFDYVVRNANLIEAYPWMDPDYPDLIAAEAIKEKLSLGSLYLWGRKADQSFDLEADFSACPLERIEVDDWDKLAFTLYWLDYDEDIALYGEVKTERLVHAMYAQERYLDLRFCSSQIMSSWPEVAS